MAFKYYLGITDYIIIALTLLISVAIGIKFGFSGGRQRTNKEYLMAGKDMPKFPVILSVVVTLVSAISLVGTPSEVYRFGLQPVISTVSRSLGMLISSYVFIPVYFQCGVTTVYEFIEMRYGRTTRTVVSFLFLLQMVLYMIPVLYAPVLALSAVTNLSIGMSIIIFGTICTFYCAIGGLKGVLWTDVFQCLLMSITITLILVCGISDAGGVANIYNRTKEGQRLDIFNFQLDISTRYTFWNSFSTGLLNGIASYGVSQVEVQRLLSLSDVRRAQSCLRLSIMPLWITYLSCYFIGLVLYAIYYLCDPILNNTETGLTKYDQLIPYYIINKFSSLPGVTGLCIAGIFSGSLSTFSSALNSLATVTVVDFIVPYIPTIRLNERKSVLLAKTLSVTYGLFCIGMCFAFLKASSLIHIAHVLVSVIEGPVVVIFIVGVLSQNTSEKSALFGLLVGFSFACWIGCASLFGGYLHEPLSLNTSSCISTHNSSEITPIVLKTCSNEDNCTYNLSTPSVNNSRDIFILNRVAFYWLRFMGFFVTGLFTFLAVLATGWSQEVISADSKCLSPVARLWKKKKQIIAEQMDFSCNIDLEEQKQI